MRYILVRKRGGWASQPPPPSLNPPPPLKRTPPQGGHTGPRHMAALQSFGIGVKNSVKYLGVLIGHVSSEEAYAPIIARAMHQAQFMRSLLLTHEEHIALFQEWVLPLIIVR